MDFAKNYSVLTDDTLKRLALYEYEQLLPEAQAALNAEMKRRGIDKEVAEFHEIQREVVTPVEFDEIARQYRSMACPFCGERCSGINVHSVGYLYFVYFFASWGVKEFVGCSRCLPRQFRLHQRLLIMLAFCFPIQTVLSFIMYRSINSLADELRETNKPTPAYFEYVSRNLLTIKQSIRREGAPSLQ